MQEVPGSIPTPGRKSVEISVGFGTQALSSKSATKKYYEASYSPVPTCSYICITDTSKYGALCLQCFDAVGWASGKASGL